ncbi:hypothetical protein BAUCODRAFT_33979 [Baudoinia panamericana UAMH 10762]|uniref:Uncharacterized protein n=1 Tax=Baudoinia panamericana (strain UAMH 10762) TaxID=717646 RepID=M2MIX5_BAUPA|nr:uncharacterized protein BAUCODRAFT_33979 [Baudoinia panamericana UAMH 10762]EMC96616.1 hypothetical protein BAUCODRAFT_33979 [Baudoinia panamericana UAMH 10762]
MRYEPMGASAIRLLTYAHHTSSAAASGHRRSNFNILQAPDPQHGNSRVLCNRHMVSAGTSTALWHTFRYRGLRPSLGAGLVSGRTLHQMQEGKGPPCTPSGCPALTGY